MRWLICIALIFLFLGCRGREPSKLRSWLVPNGKVKVLCTTAIIDDLVGQIGGDRVDHLPLIEGPIDPHSYQLIKGDDEKFFYAQIVFHNGLGLEHGAGLQNHLKKHPKACGLGDVLYQKNRDLILEEGGVLDPHIWLDVRLWSEVVLPIVQVLSEVDPEGRTYYEERGNRVHSELVALDEKLWKNLQEISQSKKYLVTSHDAFNYFARRYLGDDWKMRLCAPEGIAPDGQLSCDDLRRVVDYLFRYQIRVVFPESNVSTIPLQRILSACAENGWKAFISMEPLYADVMGLPGSSSDTYQKMMEYNLRVLCEAWKE